jgi:hypothetical protein
MIVNLKVAMLELMLPKKLKVTEKKVAEIMVNAERKKVIIRQSTAGSRQPTKKTATRNPKHVTI